MINMSVCQSQQLTKEWLSYMKTSLRQLKSLAPIMLFIAILFQDAFQDSVQMKTPYKF